MINMSPAAHRAKEQAWAEWRARVASWLDMRGQKTPDDYPPTFWERIAYERAHDELFYHYPKEQP